METKKKQFKMPHTFVIIGIIILLAVLLTWIIPAGSYTRFENEAGIKVIDPNDFNYIDKTPVNPLEIPLYIVKAFIKRIDLMLVIMFAGGAFHILTKTGALHAVVAKMAKVFSTRVYLFLPILTLVFGLICTTQGVNLFIAFAPIMVMMAFAMGLDSITGASIILLGGAIGFSTGPLNINTTIVAQKIAGLPLYSGVGYRFICFAVFYVITNIYLIRYALKIQKHPELSPMYELDKTSEFRDAADLDSFGKLDARKILIMLVFFASLILIVYGGIKLDWDMSETASVFLALAVIEGVLGGFGPSAISKEFLEGCKKMLGAAFIIGMAQAISSIMNAGHITDTVVHALANGLNFVPTILLGPAMLLANTIINVFLTSGSGQAAAVIPILAPLADLVGVTRQTAILSFNFGDGFCNYVLPTSTALMGIISAVTSTAVAIVLGSIAGYFGGKVDNILMRIVDIIYSLPDMLMVVLLSVVLREVINVDAFPALQKIGTNMISMFIVFALLYWTGMARMVRGQILTVKQNEYILAARVSGAKDSRIIRRHILPNIVSVIIIAAALQIPSAIFTESFLSFIGLGVQAPMPSLGSLANEARAGITQYPYKLLFPAGMICLITLAFNLLGDGLRDAFDPKLRR